MTRQQDHSVVYIGSYAEADTPGLYTCRFNHTAGALTIIQEESGLQNPTFLAIDPQHHRLYTIMEDVDDKGHKYGLAAAYRIDGADGQLHFLNKQRTVDAGTCHIALDQEKKWIVVSSYHGGMIGLLPLESDGRIGAVSDVQQHEGSSIKPVQSQARAHSVTFDATNRYAIACDLGADQLIVYRFDRAGGKLIAHSSVKAEPGAGPRHFVFHPTLPVCYVINELNATITAYSFDSEAGVLHPMETVSTVPETYTGDNACADIHISPDSQFLYGSNRGHDSIVVFKIAATDGRLSFVEHVSSGGEHPRNFALSPDGAFVLVANRDTNNVVIFKRDAATGKLHPNGQTLAVAKPVCIKFLES